MRDDELTADMLRERIRWEPCCPGWADAVDIGGRNSAFEIDRSKMSDSDAESIGGGFLLSLGRENSDLEETGADAAVLPPDPSWWENAEWTRLMSFSLCFSVIGKPTKDGAT